MAITERYLDVDLTTGLNDGTSEANAWQSWAAADTGLAAGQRLNVKNPSARSDEGSTTISISLVTAADTPLHIRGYGSTIGDGTAAQFENLTLSFNGTSHSNILVQDIDILNAGAAGASCFTSGNAYGTTFYNCKAVNNGGGASEVIRCFQCTGGGNVVNCYAEANGTSYSVGGSAGLIDIHNGVAYANVCVFGTSYENPAGDLAAIRCNAAVEGNAQAVRNVCINKSGHMVQYGIRSNGISTSNCDGISVVNNTVYGPFAQGINVEDGGTGTDGSSCYANNLVIGAPVSFSTNGSNHVFPIFNNAYDGHLGGLIIDIGGRRITADPFTNSASYDLTLNAAVGGGEVCRARAADATGGTLDIGALGA
jgi:hypothetical protein